MNTENKVKELFDSYIKNPESPARKVLAKALKKAIKDLEKIGDRMNPPYWFREVFVEAMDPKYLPYPVDETDLYKHIPDLADYILTTTDKDAETDDVTSFLETVAALNTKVEAVEKAEFRVEHFIQYMEWIESGRPEEVSDVGYRKLEKENPTLAAILKSKTPSAHVSIGGDSIPVSSLTHSECAGLLKFVTQIRKELRELEETDADHLELWLTDKSHSQVIISSIAKVHTDSWSATVAIEFEDVEAKKRAEKLTGWKSTGLRMLLVGVNSYGQITRWGMPQDHFEFVGQKNEG